MSSRAKQAVRARSAHRHARCSGRMKKTIYLTLFCSATFADAFASVGKTPDYAFYSDVTNEVVSFMRVAFTKVVGTQTITQFLTDTTIGCAFKPIPSLDGSKLVVFIQNTTDNVCLGHSGAEVAVMDRDGSNLKRLTENPEFGSPFNPNWLRDGSDRITFNQQVDIPFARDLPPQFRSQVVSTFITSADSDPGEEVLLTTGWPSKVFYDAKMVNQTKIGSERVFDSFEDGSMLMLRWSASSQSDQTTKPCRLTFDASRNNTDAYVPPGVLSYATSCTDFTLKGFEWNEAVFYMFISSSQKYITYLKGSPDPLKGKACFAEIDLEKNVISNENCFYDAQKEEEEELFIWYAKMTQDEAQILYSKSEVGYTGNGSEGGQGRVYAYDIANKTTKPVSSNDDTYWHRYVSPLHYNVPMSR